MADGTKVSAGQRGGKRESERSGFVQSLNRALALLEVLAEDSDGFRLVDVAQRVGLAPSTAHRLLTTLEQKRFVQLDRQTGLWHIGVRCYTVGSVFLHRRNLVTQSYPLMKRLRDTVGETVNLGVMAEDEIVFLGQVESRELMRAISRPGGRTAMHWSGMGKALLAVLPEAERRRIIAEHGLSRSTPRTIVNADALDVELNAIAQRGWALDDEEHAVGLRCVAAVIYDEYSQPLAAISLSGPAVRITTDRMPALAGHVMRAADEITLILGGRKPVAEA